MRKKYYGGIRMGFGSLIIMALLFMSAGIGIGLALPGIAGTDKGAGFNSPSTPLSDEPREEHGQEQDIQAAPPEKQSDINRAAREENEIQPTEPPRLITPDKSREEGLDYKKAAAYVESMTVYEKICQMLITTPDSITGVQGTRVAGQTTKAALEKYPVGGLVHFLPNIESDDQITTFNSTVQSYAKTPMFISVDEEGGRVGRLKTALGAHDVGAMLTYEHDGENIAFDNAVILSTALKKHGFNTDFAPVADVWSNPANTVIGDRAYSTDFNTASKLVSEAVRGFRESGVVCSLKHFPGHGDTQEDSHDGKAYVNKTLEQLRNSEFAPFVAGIAAGADMVMVGHIVVPDIDERPASLSKKIITEVLRGELGFDGVVITDSLEMGAITSNYSPEYVAVAAVEAGNDILLLQDDVDKIIAALMSAVASGEIPESRIDESVIRIIMLKAERGIIRPEML